MRYARLINGEMEIELSNEEIGVNELCDFEELIESVCMGNNIENGLVMVSDGIVLVDNDSVDLVVEFKE